MKAIITLFLLCLTTTAFARDLGVLYSEPNETKVAFLVRVAINLQDHTAETGNEACGLIAERDGQYSVILQTNDVQVLCDADSVMRGWTNTGENIHSHPVPTRAGNQILLTDATKKAIREHRNGRIWWTVRSDEFSNIDYRNGPGYLAANNTLYYQRGAGTSIVVATFQE